MRYRRRSSAHDYFFPLDLFCGFIGHDPWHFWGMSEYSINPKMGCDGLVREYSHMATESAGRQDIRQAINQGIGKLTRYLGYSPLPHAVHDFALNPLVATRAARNIPGRPGVYVQLSEGFVQSLGVPEWSLIESVSVILHDDDGDGYHERFTASATMPPSITTIDDLGVFFVAADRPGSAPLSQAYQVAPIDLELSGTNLSITGDSWLIARPILYEGYSQNKINNGLDPTDLTIFAGTLAIAQRSINDAGAVQVTTISGGYCCSATSAATVDSTAEIISARQGLIRIGSWCSCSAPRRVNVKYVAGLPLVDQLPDPGWIDTICKLGCAELARRVCVCDYPNAPIFEYGQDLADTNQGMSTAPDDIQNPIGTRRGHVEAWRAIKHLFNTISHLP